MAKTTNYSPRLKTEYFERIVPRLKDQFKLSNNNEVPRLTKIVVNVGLGRAKDDKKIIETATNTLRKITGQQPIETAAKKSIASFKLREGNKIGLKVTLRNDNMYEFLDRFINLVLPRLRDFHGVSLKSFDHQGNYSIGITDQSVFPELTFEETTTSHGLELVLVIKTKSIEQSRALLSEFGLPFEKERG